MRLDLFCRVIDNYGDAGVAWRLARQLAREHGVRTALWIDVPGVLARIVPGLDPAATAAQVDSVAIRSLADAGDAMVSGLPDAVVEAFGCGLPDAYLEAMARAPRPPVWVNLEYLSAEAWIESAHGLPSPQPRLPLTRHFFFPGFTPRTGGLLRERDLLAHRDAARAPPGARLPRPVDEALATAGVSLHDAALVASLFCYPNGALAPLLDAWAEGDERVLCLVPEGVAAASLDAWLAGAVPHAGQALRRGALTLAGIPFVSQDAYDRLLWACGVNFVRGEDSFVRAQWAAAPFAWHVYPQLDDAHLVKLDAFLARYLDCTGDVGMAVRAFWLAWNTGDPEIATYWRAFRAVAPALAAHNARWARALAGLPDLAGNLLEFCRERL